MGDWESEREILFFKSISFQTIFIYFVKVGKKKIEKNPKSKVIKNNLIENKNWVKFLTGWTIRQMNGISEFWGNKLCCKLLKWK